MNFWVTVIVHLSIICLGHLQFFHSYELLLKPSRFSLFYPLRIKPKSDRGTSQSALENRRTSSYLPARRFDEKVKNLKYIDRKKRNVVNATGLLSNITNTLLDIKRRPIKRIGIIHIKNDNIDVNKYNTQIEKKLNEKPSFYNDNKGLNMIEEKVGLRLPRKAVKITGETRIKINNPNDVKKDDEGIFDKVFSYSFDAKSSKEEYGQAHQKFQSQENRTYNNLQNNDILSKTKYLIEPNIDGTRLDTYEDINEHRDKQEGSQTLYNNDQEIKDAQHHSSYSSSNQRPFPTTYSSNPFMINLSQSYLRLRPRQYNVSSLSDSAEYYYPNFENESNEKGSISSFRPNHLDNENFRPSFPDFSEYIPSLPISNKPASKHPDKPSIDLFREFEEEIIKSDFNKQHAKRIKDENWMKPKTNNTESNIHLEENNIVRNHNIFLVSPPKQSKSFTNVEATNVLNLNSNRDKEHEPKRNKHMWPESTTQFPIADIRSREPRRRNKYQEIPIPAKEKPYEFGSLVKYKSDSMEKNNRFRSRFENHRSLKNDHSFRIKEDLNDYDITKVYNDIPSLKNHNNRSPIQKDKEDGLKSLNHEEMDFYRPNNNNHDTTGSFQTKDTNINNNSFVEKKFNDNRYSLNKFFLENSDKDLIYDNNYDRNRYKEKEPLISSYKVELDSLYPSFDDLHSDFFSEANDYQKRKFRENRRNRHRLMDSKFAPAQSKKFRNQHYYNADDYEEADKFYRFRKFRDNDDNHSRSIYRYNRKRPRQHRKIANYDDHHNMKIRPDFRLTDDDYKISSNSDYNSLHHYDPYFEEMRDYNDYLYRKTKDFQNHHYYQKMKEYYDDHDHIDDRIHYTLSEDTPLNRRIPKTEYFQPVRELNLYELPSSPLIPPPLIPPPLISNRHNETQRDISRLKTPYAQSSYVKAYSDEDVEEKRSRYQNFDRSRGRVDNYNRKNREDNIKFPEYSYDIDETFEDFPQFGYFKREPKVRP